MSDADRELELGEGDAEQEQERDNKVQSRVKTEQEPECDDGVELGGSNENESDSKFLPPCAPRAYGHAYWLNGWKKHPRDKSPDLLFFETGNYGLTFDMRDLKKVGFGTFDDDLSYADVLDESKRGRMDDLIQENLMMEVQENGKTYTAETCLAGTSDSRGKARLWEAGRITQHYELLGVVFRDAEEAELVCDCHLDIVVWPESFALTLTLNPKEGTTWAEGANVRMELKDWSANKAFIGEWDANETKSISLKCDVTGKGSMTEGIGIQMDANGQPNINVSFDSLFNSYVGRVHNPPRPFRAGYTDIRNFDKFHIVIQNDSEESKYVPFLLFLTMAANPTGMVPMVCDVEGNPLGIPIQTSKNWHFKPLKKMLRAYTLLPASPGQTEYLIQVVYGFYGSLPSASHGNLSLVGWGKDKANGRWEQLAIGCWGETFCMDIEFCATRHNIITDVRALMTNPGPSNGKWNWTDAGWGGDWISVRDDCNWQLCTREMKVAYISQGPCLTDVQYGGYYGGGIGVPGRAISLQATVRTLRTDDYARTFLTLRYTFNCNLRYRGCHHLQGDCLFRMGGCGRDGLSVPRIAIGNKDGLIEEYELPFDLKPKSFFQDRVPIEGPGPWWIAFPGMQIHEDKVHGKKGTAWKALIIQSFEASLGGNVYANPNISFLVRDVYQNSAPNIHALLTLPEGISKLAGGDFVSMDLYWATLPHDADKYYGPNEFLRKKLEEMPDSWKMILEEVQGNNLGVEVIGGELKHAYPLIIQSTDPEITLNIVGGVGAVPIRFDGLRSPLYRLHRSTEDGTSEVDDMWQTNYDPDSYTFSITYNVPLDGMETSSWVLKI